MLCAPAPLPVLLKFMRFWSGRLMQSYGPFVDFVEALREGRSSFLCSRGQTTSMEHRHPCWILFGVGKKQKLSLWFFFCFVLGFFFYIKFE